MKKLITFILIIFIAYSGYSQDRAVRVNVVKYDPITTTIRDTYVVPANQVWKIYNSTAARWEENVGGTGWIESASGGGGGTTTDAGDLITGTLDDARLSSSVTASLGLADSALQVEVDGSVTNELQTLSILGNTLSISDGNSVTIPSSGGGGASDWGDLGGTLSDQTDLQAELDDKAKINTGSPKQWIGFASGTQAEIDANMSAITNATPANGTTFIFPTDAAAGTDGFVTGAAFTDIDADTKRLTLTMNGVMSDLTADFDLPTGGGSFELVTDLTPELGGDFDGGGFDMHNIRDITASDILADGIQTPTLNATNSFTLSSSATSNMLGYVKFYESNKFIPSNGSFLSSLTHSLEEGEVYWNSTDNRLKAYDGTSWKNFLLEGDVSGGGSGSFELVNDLTPELGGDFDGGGFDMSNIEDITSNGIQVFDLDVYGSLSLNTIANADMYGYVKLHESNRFVPLDDSGVVTIGHTIEEGEFYWGETDSRLKVYDGSNWKNFLLEGDQNKGGTTANRPSSPKLYEFWFDETLGYPIWYNGTNWVDATGTTR